MPRAIWLASHPKSGNTWFRVFLANLMHPQLARSPAPQQGPRLLAAPTMAYRQPRGPKLIYPLLDGELHRAPGATFR